MNAGKKTNRVVSIFLQAVISAADPPCLDNLIIGLEKHVSGGTCFLGQVSTACDEIVTHTQ